MSVQVSPYVITPVVPFVTLQTISLPVTGPAGTVPVSLGIGNTTSFQAVPPADLSTAVILAPGTVDRNLIQATANTVKGLSVKAKAGSTAYIFDVQDANGNQIIKAATSNVDNAFNITPPNNNTALGITLVTGANQPFINAVSADGAGMTLLSTAEIDLFQISDLGGASCASIVPTFTDPSNANVKSRLTLNTFDGSFGANKRENIRMEADGTAPRIGFLGANAVVRQTGGAATASAIYGATEQAMLQKAYDALRTFGFLT